MRVQYKNLPKAIKAKMQKSKDWKTIYINRASLTVFGYTSFTIIQVSEDNVVFSLSAVKDESNKSPDNDWLIIKKFLSLADLEILLIAKEFIEKREGK